jgi:hypothetical protein
MAVLNTSFITTLILVFGLAFQQPEGDQGGQ